MLSKKKKKKPGVLPIAQPLARVISHCLPRCVAQKIITAAVARLYLAAPDPDQWAYTGYWGALALLRDSKRNDAYFLCMINIEASIYKQSTKKRLVVWEQEVYSGMQVHQEAPYFYTFDADSCLAGLEFAEDDEGCVFFDKYQHRGTKRGPAGDIKKKKTTGRGQRSITKDMISAPSDFVHVRHIGHTPNKGYSLHGDQSHLSGLYKQLQSMGISESEIEQNQEFIQSYINEQKRQKGPAGIYAKSRSQPRAPPPPPPPSRTTNQRQAGAQPSNGPRPPLPSRPRPTNGPQHPQPPALPPHPPIQPARVPGSGAPPPPPPPQAAPMAHGAVSGTAPTKTGDNRANLMASIRAAGGFSSLKQEGHLRIATTPIPVPNADVSLRAPGVAASSHSPASASPSDLASTLAAALQNRKTAMDSDDEDEQDDEEWE
ncbi:hypothetical protein BC940DRAFT_270946 [Gongronella butleri]|nr:hypothetical protein BC940DRAFT_270946 [Gongronella butleri]